MESTEKIKKLTSFTLEKMQEMNFNYLEFEYFIKDIVEETKKLKLVR